MNAPFSRQIIGTLKEKQVTFFTSVPCKLLANMIALLEQDTEVTYHPATREDEGLGMCAGASLASAWRRFRNGTNWSYLTRSHDFVPRFARHDFVDPHN